jgi:4-hydroxysphinganine ceramide fatty acyl 2-hydroxylase
MVRAFARHGSNGLLIAATAIGIAAIASKKLPFRPASIATGIALFFSSEYGTHRFLLHAAPSKDRTVLGLQKRLHYDHHLEPARLDLLFLPPWFLVPALAGFAGAYAVVTRDGSRTASLAFGNVLGLLYYEWVHYVAHVPFVPVTPVGKAMKKYHLRHHFKNEKLWFGVTNSAFDHLWSTYARVVDAEKSETVKTLFDLHATP